MAIQTDDNQTSWEAGKVNHGLLIAILNRSAQSATVSSKQQYFAVSIGTFYLHAAIHIDETVLQRLLNGFVYCSDRTRGFGIAKLTLCGQIETLDAVIAIVQGNIDLIGRNH